MKHVLSLLMFTVAHASSPFLALPPRIESPGDGERIPTDNETSNQATRVKVHVIGPERDQCQTFPWTSVCLQVDSFTETCLEWNNRLTVFQLETLRSGFHSVQVCSLTNHWTGERKLCSPVHVIHVVERKPFHLSTEWSRIERWQSIPAGLEVKLDFDGGVNGNRFARIPRPWQATVSIVSATSGERVDRISAVFLTHEGAPSALEQLTNALKDALGVPSSCLDLNGIPADMVDLFLYSSARQSVLVRFADNSVNLACRCLKQSPCGASLWRLQRCTTEFLQQRRSENGWPSRKQLDEACPKESQDYLQCTVACSGFNDPFLLGSAPSSKRIEKSEFVSRLQSYKVFNSSIPGAGSSVVCRNCMMRDRRLALLVSGDLARRASREIVLAKSRFAPYYGFEGGGVLNGSLVDIMETDDSSIHCTRFFDSPVMITSVWSLVNVYHLLSDVLLPAFHTFVEHGENPSDAVVFVDVGHAEERSKLQVILEHARRFDSPLSLLFRVFRSVHTLEALRQGQGSSCFRKVFLETDISTTPHFYAHAAQPKTASTIPGKWDATLDTVSDATQVQALQKRLGVVEKATKRFREWLSRDWSWAKQRLSRPPSDGISVTIVKRHSTRKFTDFVSLKQATRSLLSSFLPKVHLKEVSPERLSFSKQLQIYSQTDFFVCAHGQGCSNLFFLPYGSVCVLIMPRGWHGWRWMYANLGRAAGVQVIVHEFLDEPVAPLSDQGWDGTDSDYEDCDLSGFHFVRDPPLRVDLEGWNVTMTKALKVWLEQKST